MANRRLTVPGVGAKKISQRFLRRLATMAMRNDVMTWGTGIAGIFTDSFSASFAGQQQSGPNEILVVRLTEDILPRFESDFTDEGSQASEASQDSASSSAVQNSRFNAVVQRWNDTTGAFVDTGDTLRVEDGYGLVYDKDSIQVVFLQTESDKYFIIPQRTVRLATTVADVDDEYPRDSDDDDSIPLTYAIRFVNLPYSKVDGETDRGTPTEKNNETANDPPHAYAMNLLDFYIEEGSLIWVFALNGQWYTASIDGYTGEFDVVTRVECEAGEGDSEGDAGGDSEGDAAVGDAPAGGVSGGTLKETTVSLKYRHGILVRKRDTEESDADPNAQPASEASGYTGGNPDSY